MFFHIKNNKNWAIVLFKEGGTKMDDLFLFSSVCERRFSLGDDKTSLSF